MSSEITSFRVPTTWSDGEGNAFFRVSMRSVELPCGVLEPGMCGHLLHGNRETLYLVFTYKDPHAWDLYGGCRATGVPIVTQLVDVRIAGSGKIIVVCPLRIYIRVGLTPCNN